MTTLVIPSRFRGPARSGNGGWTAGAVAAFLDPAVPTPAPVTVMLRQPPPLEVDIDLTTSDGVATASYDGAVVATARHTDVELTPTVVVGVEPARHAEASYPGLSRHPFPTCFVCGTDRAEGDGLRIFPGQVGDEPVAAATWTPTESTYAITWAALDCAGAWAADMGERLMVLGTITATLHALPVVGETYVVTGEDRGREGRKTFSAASLHDAQGRLLATAEHVWIAVDPAAFQEGTSRSVSA